ncbi:hypothetical protein BN903_441 [Halorubrum sp. AJ67]|nr:hypothetical protein BN903_441 [Halorubrum sp. AJ67]
MPSGIFCTMFLPNKRTSAVIGLALLLVIGSGAILISDGQESDYGEYPPIETATQNPPVDDVGTYRILASNDIDVNSTGNNDDIFSVTSQSVDLRTYKVDRPLLRLDERTYTVDQTTEFAQLTDGFREALYTEYQVTTDDTWMSYDEAEVTDLVHIGQSRPVNESIMTSDDNLLFAEIEGRGGTIPVRNAEFIYEKEGDTLQGVTVLNPSSAEVYEGEFTDYTELNQDVVRSTFINTSTNLSIVPAAGYGNNSARYDVQGGTAEGYWQDEVEVIHDHYADVARMDEGALYDDYWLVNPDQVNITTVYDYRTTTPEDYSSSEQCSYISGNETLTGTDTKYEEWEIIESSSVMSLQNDNEYYVTENDQNILTIDNPQSGRLGLYSDVLVGLELTYGVNSTCPGNSWEKTKKVSAASAFHDPSYYTIEAADATDLTIDAYLVENAFRDEIYFDIIGDQRPEENPLGSIELKANEECIERGTLLCKEHAHQDQYKIHSPWIFLSQSLYDRVEYRRDGSAQWVRTSVKHNETPNLHRDYMDAAGYRTSASNTLGVKPTMQDQAQIYEGINLGENVIDTGGDVQLYRTVGSQLSQPVSELEDIEITATDVFGNDVPIGEVHRITVEPTRIISDLNTTTYEVTGTFKHSETDDPVPNREIIIDGESVHRTTTNSDGEFTQMVSENVSTVDVRFEGDPLREDFDTHYGESSTKVWTGKVALNIVRMPIGYLHAMISNLLVFINWIVLGLFLVWWMKYRD